MAADDTQVGGSHYQDIAKGGEQHWTMMWRLYREAWFVGCITKYLFRYRKKNGIEDLKKAQHYLQKLIELESAEVQVHEEAVARKFSDTPFCQAPHQFKDGSTKICVLPLGHTGSHKTKEGDGWQ